VLDCVHATHLVTWTLSSVIKIQAVYRHTYSTPDNNRLWCIRNWIQRQRIATVTLKQCYSKLNSCNSMEPILSVINILSVSAKQTSPNPELLLVLLLTPPSSRIPLFFSNLSWLKINERIEYKLVSLIHMYNKIVHTKFSLLLNLLIFTSWFLFNLSLSRTLALHPSSPRSTRPTLSHLALLKSQIVHFDMSLELISCFHSISLILIILLIRFSFHSPIVSPAPSSQQSHHLLLLYSLFHSKLKTHVIYKSLAV